MKNEISVQNRSLSRTESISIQKKYADLIFIFLINPFLSLWTAIKHYKKSYTKNILWFFVIYYGFTLVISNAGIDANRVRDKLIAFYNASISFDNVLAMVYVSGEGYLDIVQPVVLFAVSRFTDNYNILFAVYGFIFGYFYSRNIWYLLEKSDFKVKKEYILFIVSFAFIVGFWNINGFRMWTAAHVFFYGAIRYLIESRKKHLLVASTAIFFHFSFIFPLSVLLLFVVLKDRINLYFWFFIVTFFLAEIDILLLRSTLLSILPDFFHSKVIAYTHERYAESRIIATEEMIWYAKYYGTALRWVIVIMLSLIYFNNKDKIKNNFKELLPLLGFSFLIFGAANLIRHVPSGGRFMSVAALFGMALIVLVLNKLPAVKIIKTINPLTKFALIFFCVLSFRLGMDTIGLMTILGNPFIAAFIKVDIALIQLFQFLR